MEIDGSDEVLALAGELKVIARTEFVRHAIVTLEPSKYFANLGLQAARHRTFKPAQVVGQAVSSVWVLRFQFGQGGTDVTPSEASP
jgi:hypothetical protein